MGLVNYVLAEAQAKTPLSTADVYNAERSRIYTNLLKQNVSASSILSTERFNKLSEQYEVLKQLPKELDNIAPTSSERGNYVFNGSNDNAVIQQLIAQAKNLQKVEDFDEYTKKLNELEEANKFVTQTLRGSIPDNIYAIATKDYQNLKKAIETAAFTKDIQAAQKAAKIYFSGLIGNLGESIGTLEGYSIVSQKLQKELAKAGIKVQVTNTSSINIGGKRAVGDTTVQFVYHPGGNGPGELIGSISMSNKLTANYGKTDKIHIKLRTTTANQLSAPVKATYYNLYSLHGQGTEHHLELSKDKAAIMAFRRYVASTIMQENLFGAFKGDNVYYFNYGDYIYTMNDLLKYWTSDYTDSVRIPNINFPGVTKRMSFLNGVTTEEEAEAKISQQEIIVTYNLHLGNLKAALGS